MLVPRHQSLPKSDFEMITLTIFVCMYPYFLLLIYLLMCVSIHLTEHGKGKLSDLSRIAHSLLITYPVHIVWYLPKVPKYLGWDRRCSWAHRPGAIFYRKGCWYRPMKPPRNRIESRRRDNSDSYQYW